MPTLSNQRREIFAQEVAKGATNAAALKAAGYSGQRTTACRLAQKPEVAARIAELKERAATNTVTTVETLLEAGWDIVRQAVADQQHAAASQTLERIAKIAGLWVDKSEGKNDSTVTVVDAEAASRARESFERVGAAFATGSQGSGAGTLPH